MSKALLRTTGDESDDADVGGLAEEDVGADVLVFGDLAFFGGAEGGHHVDGGVEIVNGIVLAGDSVDSACCRSQRAALGSAASFRAMRRRRTRQDDKTTARRQMRARYNGSAPEKHYFIVGSGKPGCQSASLQHWMCYIHLGPVRCSLYVCVPSEVSRLIDPGVMENGPARWACGAVGSALPWHGRGRRFEPVQVHQIPSQTKQRHTRIT